MDATASSLVMEVAGPMEETALSMSCVQMRFVRSGKESMQKLCKCCPTASKAADRSPR